MCEVKGLRVLSVQEGVGWCWGGGVGVGWRSWLLHDKTWFLRGHTMPSVRNVTSVCPSLPPPPPPSPPAAPTGGGGGDGGSSGSSENDGACACSGGGGGGRVQLQGVSGRGTPTKIMEVGAAGLYNIFCASHTHTTLLAHPSAWRMTGTERGNGGTGWYKRAYRGSLQSKSILWWVHRGFTAYWEETAEIDITQHVCIACPEHARGS
jgi:hypothetical protein